MSLQEDRRARVSRIGWYHSIDLGDGLVTPGLSANRALSSAELPAFEGRTVLDIGAWDGYYSFLAERSGAERVVALDHYAWGVDIAARDRYWKECAANGVLPDHSRDLQDFWNPDLPGKRGFDLAHEILGSSVEAVVGDLLTTDLEALGTFDVVLYLGVLYHVKDPLGALERVRQVTAGTAVIETEAVQIGGHEEASILQFHAGRALNRDYGNWYVPTMAALEGMALAAGFSGVDRVSGPPPAPTRRRLAPRMLGRVLNRASWLIVPPGPWSRNYRAVIHAKV